MQFLWKHIDDILGKGFTMFEILEVIFYYGVSLIPLALPISILIASVMVFGDMSEKHELPTMKSAGLSLIRIMRGGLILALMTFFFSIFASNYLKPTALFQFKKRFDVIRKQKSTLAIEEKVFNDDFNNFVIRVNEKLADDKTMKEVLIYDHTKPDKSLVNLISSDSAEMYSTKNGRYFIMNLYNGVQYQENNREKKKEGGLKYPLTTTHFKSYKKILDMSEFYLDENDITFNKKRQDLLNTFQILDVIDSLNQKKQAALESIEYSYDNLIKEETDTAAIAKPSYVLPSDIKEAEEMRKKSAESSKRNNNRRKSKKSRGIKGQAKQKSNKALDTVSMFYEMFLKEDFYRVVNRAVSIGSARSDIGVSVHNKISGVQRTKEKYIFSLNTHYSHAFICLIFFFIGAPLGSIIRKGGYGYSLLIAIIFYMVFIMTSIAGEKLLKSATLNGISGAWLSCVILFPFSVIFTQKALNDVKFDLPSKLSNLFSRKKDQ